MADLQSCERCHSTIEGFPSRVDSFDLCLICYKDFRSWIGHPNDPVSVVELLDGRRYELYIQSDNTLRGYLLG